MTFCLSTGRVNKAIHNVQCKDVIYTLEVVQGSAKTLVKLGGKLYQTSISNACFLRKISAKIIKF